jgi:hypothetical protein
MVEVAQNLRVSEASDWLVSVLPVGGARSDLATWTREVGDYGAEALNWPVVRQ